MTLPGLVEFINDCMMKSAKPVPARLQSCMVLLERLREHPSLTLEDHLSSAGQSFIGHETWGDKAHERLGIDAYNSTHGRRSSNLHDWASRLLKMLSDSDFERKSDSQQCDLINEIQEALARPLRELLEQEPIRVRYKARSVSAAIRDILDEAHNRRRLGDVAQYLVGAKLKLRFPSKQSVIQQFNANLGDRKSRVDSAPRRGDFDLGTYVFEVAVGSPDQKHIDQASSVACDPDTEFWLIVRHDKAPFWVSELIEHGVPMERVIVVPIDTFVGQNITELGDLDKGKQALQLSALVDEYNRSCEQIPGRRGILLELD